MDTFNLNVYVEQVNHEADSTTANKWEENEEQALSNVIDPNTEFKIKQCGNSTKVTPSNSYGLSDEPEQKPETEVEPPHTSGTTSETHILEQKYSSRDFIQCQSECLDKELGVDIEGYTNRRKRSIPDSSHMAKVHAYTSSQLLPTQEENNTKEMDPEANVNFDTNSKLLKYPQDRITVVSEKCSYLTKSPTKTKVLDPYQKHRKTPVKENIHSSGLDSPLSGASSHESISTASVTSGHFHRRSSLVSNNSVNNMASETSFRLDRSMTTADQLAWEFRRARDRLDTASNLSGCSSRFELDSNYSERADTMSTISDVSGYEEEMFRIKRLLLLDSSTPTPPPIKYNKIKDLNVSPPLINKCEVTTSHKENTEIQIHRLTVQLQNALAEKEKYRIETLAAENRIALEWQEKHQEALRQKAHLEGRLETVQAELSSLASEQREILERNKVLEQELKLRSGTNGETAIQEMERLVAEINKLQQTIREVENKNEDLAVQVELKDSEIRQLKKEILSTEDTNEKLRIELQEVKVDSDSKDGSIQGLKNKISDQHIEFQSLLQAKLKAENSLTSLKNEMESVKKSGYWYRDQLHACQAAKVKVQQDLMSTQSNAVSQSHYIEKLKGEITNMQHLVEETQLRAVREKEALMRKLEVIQADMLEREATIFSQIQNESTSDTINSIASKLKKIEEEKNRMINSSDAAVQELKEEITSLRNQLNAKEALLETSTTENSELMSRATTLQKALNEKEVALQLLENKYKNTEMSHNQLVESLRVKEQNILDLKNEKVSVEVALAAAGREKTEVDAVIVKLKEDFTRITCSYQSMKTELREKDKYLLNMKNDLTGLQKENHSLLEKIGNFKKMEEEYKVLQGRIAQTEVLEQQVEQMTKLNRELSMKVNELNEAHSFAKKEVMRMEETVAAREEQLINQTKNFEVHSEEMKTKELTLVEMQSEKASLEEHVKLLQEKISDYSDSKKKLISEISSLKNQVLRANGAIDQFNMLCRKSEEEKSLLEKKVKQLLDNESQLMKKISEFSDKENESQSKIKELLDKENQSESKIKELLESESKLENRVKELSEKENQLGNEIKAAESPTSNGGLLISETVNLVQAAPEVPSGLLKAMSLFDNGFLQTHLRTYFDMLQKTESKLSLLLSENIGHENEKPVDKPSAIQMETILTLLVNINDYATKALKWKDQILKEIKLEKEISQGLKNEIINIQNGPAVNLSSHEKNNISRSSQTNIVNLVPIGTQTVNDDAVKFKEQVESYLKEITRLKTSLKMNDIEHREKTRRYEANVRTLLKKVKEHMRGRRAAERTLEEIRSRTENNSDLIQLKRELEDLQTQLEASQKKYEEQRKLAEKNQEAMLELEKERGKLAQSCTISQIKLPAVQDSQEGSSALVASEFDQKTRELQMVQIQNRVSELEEQVHKLHIINKDLRKEIFNEKCETSQLRKQVASLQMGLDTANDMLDTKKVELGRAESLCCVLRTNISHLKKQLEDEQQVHEECKQEVERLRESLEDTKAKDPVLADQIKTLSYHLHQKTQEAAGLQEKLRLSEERWAASESALQRNLSALQEELAALRSELDSIRADKFTLQTQAAELRAALQSSIEQNKVLRLRLETFGCENKDRLPDLTSSLPLPPTKYDESRIAELLHQSTVLPQNKPLNNLQCCLDSLKQEMAVLQQQIAAKTSPRELDGELKSEHSSIKDV